MRPDACDEDDSEAREEEHALRQLRLKDTERSLAGAFARSQTMETFSSQETWAGDFDDARIELRAAQRKLERVRERLLEARTRYERAQAAADRAKRMESDERLKAEQARRRADEARRRGEEARRRDTNRYRWESEARRWDGNAQRASTDIHRWTEEARRNSLRLRALADDIRARRLEHEEMMKVTHLWEERLKFVTVHGARPREAPTDSPDAPVATQADNASPEKRSPVPVDKLALQSDSASITVTQRAAAYLSGLLDGMERESNQLLRLVPDAAGGITLALDTPREGDHMVRHGGSAVLVVRTPLPERLEGKTLDIDESSAGTQVLLSG